MVAKVVVRVVAMDTVVAMDAIAVAKSDVKWIYGSNSSSFSEGLF